MKVTNIILTLVFIASAAVQFNDPDPMYWVIMYGIVAVICGMAIYEKYNKWLILLMMAVCLVEAFNLVPDFINWIEMGMPSIVDQMKAEEPHIELVREFGGLVLCFSALIFQYIQMRKQQL